MDFEILFYESKFSDMIYDRLVMGYPGSTIIGIKLGFQVHLMNEILMRYDLKLLNFLNDGTYGCIHTMIQEIIKSSSWVDGHGHKISSYS